MTYRVEHIVRFKSLHNKMPVRLDITRLNYKKTASEQVAKLKTALVIDDLDLDNDDKFTPIRGKRISAQLVARKGENFGLNALYSENPRQYILDGYINGNLIARSYYLVGQSDEPYRAKPYDFTVRATVGLGDLKDIPYLDSNGTAYQDKQSLMEIVLNCLDQLDLGIATWVICESFAEGMDESICSLSQVIIDPTRYYPNDKPMSCYEVLEDICRLFGAFISQANGVWVFAQVEQLRKDMVRVYRFDANRKAQDPLSISIAKSIATGTGVSDKPFIRFDQRVFNYDSIKLAQFEIDYGELKNRLFNPRFQLLDPTISGGQTARGWRPYNLTYRFIKPDPQTVFKDNYLEIDGVATRINDTDIGIYRVWDPQNLNNPRPGQQYPRGVDEYIEISAPFLARYDQVVECTGEFFNIGSRGVKVQVIAVPIKNADFAARLKNNPLATYGYLDEDHPWALSINESGEWSHSTGDCYVFENVKDERQGNDLKTVAKNEWSSFSIEATKGLPLKVKLDSGQTFGSTYYTVRVVLFRAAGYLENIPKSYPSPKIRYRNIKIGARDVLDVADIRKEKHELEQTRKFGVKREMVTLPLGSTGGENYYSQLFNPAGDVLTKWYKSGDTTNLMPLPALTLSDILRIYGRPTKRITGSVAHILFDTLNSIKPGGFKGKFMLAGASQNLSEEESPVTLAELHELLPSHNRRFYTINADGKEVLQNEELIPGDIEANDGDLFFTFTEPNGLNGNKLGFTGSVWSSYPNSTVHFKAHDFTVAWNDANDDGPYEVIVESLLFGQPFSNYQKIITTSDMYTTVEVPEGQAVYVKVKTTSGLEIKRKVDLTSSQLLQLRDAGRSCIGDFPAVTAVLGNAKTPTLVTFPLSSRPPQNYSPALYYAEVVNLATGETVFANAKGSVVPFASTLGIVVQMPDEWNSGLYGFRIIDGLFGDRCGIVTQITRCKDMEPILFNEAFEEGFYIEEVPG